jgi:uncharacterized protein (TIGR03083 family)
MDDDEIFALIATERLRAADVFETLDESQLAVRSLCTDWTVQEMAGHLVSPFCVSVPRFAFGALVSGGFDKYSVKVARDLGRRPISELAGLLRTNAEGRFTPPGNGPLAPLTDVLVHTRDVARPLGLDVSAPLSSWKVVLDFLVSTGATRGFVRKGRTSGLQFKAADQEWTAGEGSSVEGPSEALAMSILGRSVALSDLSGEGVAVLRQRSG